jgi:hypothetical protein
MCLMIILCGILCLRTSLEVALSVISIRDNLSQGYTRAKSLRRYEDQNSENNEGEKTQKTEENYENLESIEEQSEYSSDT